MSILAVDQALTSDFIAQAFGLPIAHENSDYKPTAGTPFVRITNFPADVRAVGLADTDVITGAFQFVLYYAEGKGAIAAKTMAQTIFDAYPVGRELTYSAQTIRVTGQERPSAFPEDGWYKVRGLIYYEGRVSRAS